MLFKACQYLEILYSLAIVRCMNASDWTPLYENFVKIENKLTDKLELIHMCHYRNASSLIYFKFYYSTDQFILAFSSLETFLLLIEYVKIANK